MSADGFTFQRDDQFDLSSAVHQAIGAASTCWESLSGTGVFDSIRAREIAVALLAEIAAQEKPLLGLATTADIALELARRLDEARSWTRMASMARVVARQADMVDIARRR